jgi:manganese-dependent inorganic pyrophosphatase
MPQRVLLLSLLVHAFFNVDAAQKEIAVFGHKVPDTDTVTSAIIYAWELKQTGLSATGYRLGDLTPETKYVLEKTGTASPPLFDADLATVAIVDTNNPEELPKGIEKAKIHSIVDHHKLSGLTNSEPLEIDMRSLCSATSILYARAKSRGLKVPKDIAGLMLAGILSDSLEFRSPTTTELDKTHAAELAKLAGLDLHDFATGMLDAKAQVDHLTPTELVMMDTKIFKIGGKKLRVSVLETTQPAKPLAKKAELLKAQKEIKEKDGIDDVLFFVVDILKEEATFLSSSPSASSIVEKAWKVTVAADGTVVLPKVLSRKKQIIPKLEAAAANSEL